MLWYLMSDAESIQLDLFPKSSYILISRNNGSSFFNSFFLFGGDPFSAATGKGLPPISSQIIRLQHQDDCFWTMRPFTCLPLWAQRTYRRRYLSYPGQVKQIAFKFLIISFPPISVCALARSGRQSRESLLNLKREDKRIKKNVSENSGLTWGDWSRSDAVNTEGRVNFYIYMHLLGWHFYSVWNTIRAGYTVHTPVTGLRLLMLAKFSNSVIETASILSTRSVFKN